jgi:hypothetical protein
MPLNGGRLALYFFTKPSAGLPDGIFSDQNWVTFGGPWNVKCWYIQWPFGIYYDHFIPVWKFSGNLRYVFFSILVHCAKKNLATLAKCIVATQATFDKVQ